MGKYVTEMEKSKSLILPEPHCFLFCFLTGELLLLLVEQFFVV